jgi:hypothetical protein
MEFTPVESSAIAEVAHHNRKLYIRFTNGRLYSYDDVPKDTYNNLINAESIGKYFHHYIQKNYACTQLAEEPV